MPDRSQIASAIAKCIEEKNQELKFNTLPSSQRNYTELRATRYYSECFRLKESGTIEFYVYLSRLDEEAGEEVLNALQDCKDDYRKKAEKVQASCEWNQNPKGNNSFKLVGYSLDNMNWQNWESFSKEQRDRVSACYRTLADICRDSHADIGALTVRRIPKGNRSGQQTSKDSQSADEHDRNLIYFGAPGTGKSHALNQKLKEDFKERYERVTFYPTYSYAQFVGCYKPVMKSVDGKEEIAYEFVAGPFLRVLVNALKDKENGNWCLVIEEINRANAAAVFGDVFQLLDRATEDSSDGRVRKGESEYKITASEDIKRFLQKELGSCESARKFLQVEIGKNESGEDIWAKCCLLIPSNMHIWATMNSADQGVFPIDTAFKRRWEFEYVGIDKGEEDCSGWKIGEADNAFLWNKVRKFINERLSDNGVNEDKLMGPWFVKQEHGKIVSLGQFKSKVLMYLWEDAARMCRTKVFKKEIKTYLQLTEKWPDVFVNVENWESVKNGWKASDETPAQNEEMRPSDQSDG